MSSKEKSLHTKVVHAGTGETRIGRSISTPIFQTSTYEYADKDVGYHEIKYLRLNNTPNHDVLHRLLAALENAESALVTSSGMAAISTALLTFLYPGEHILVQDCLYGGTNHFVTDDLAKMGIEFDFVSGTDPDSWKQKLKPKTKVFYVETISNPLIQVPELKAVADFAKAHGLVSMIDNTFASPINFRPTEWGFDLSLHSCTKFLNGHSDIVAGAVIGKSALVEKVLHKLNYFGGSLDPHSCFLLERGIKTLALRVEHQNQSALQIAKFLKTHKAIHKVYYPGLETDQEYTRAKKYLNGSGGVLSFELTGGLQMAKSLIQKLQIPIHAPSLGGVESLITRPSVSTHGGLTQDARLKIGIGDELVRLSVGIESPDDLIEDLSQALS